MKQTYNYEDLTLCEDLINDNYDIYVTNLTTKQLVHLKSLLEQLINLRLEM